MIIGISTAILFVTLIITLNYKSIAYNKEYNDVIDYLLDNEYIKVDTADAYKQGDCNYDNEDNINCTTVYLPSLNIDYYSSRHSIDGNFNSLCDYQYNLLTNYGYGYCTINQVMTSFSYDFNTGVYEYDVSSYNSNGYESGYSKNIYLDELFRLKEEAIVTFGRLAKYY